MCWWRRGFVEQGSVEEVNSQRSFRTGPGLDLGGFANLAPIRRSRNIAVHVSCDEEAGGIHGLKVAVRVVLVEVLFILSTKH